jgi:hypothetical protein
MHTKDRLAAALRELKLDIMAKRAERGYYHEFLSPLDLAEVALVNDPGHMANRRPHQRTEILAFRKRVMNGEFDATKEEGDAWAASREGQDAMRRLAEGPPTTPTDVEIVLPDGSSIPLPPDDLSYRALAAKISKAKQ